MPRSVSTMRSPWRQTPGNVEKYVSRSRTSSGSSQKRSGIEGIGSVMTISPASPGATRRPVGPHTSRAAPSATALISPSTTGVVGALATKIPTTSVPPLIDPSWMPSPTCSRTQALADAGSTEPVTPIRPSADRSRSRPGSSPARSDASR